MRAELLVLLEGSNVIENCAKEKWISDVVLLILAIGNKTIRNNYVYISSLFHNTTGNIVACGGRTYWDAWLEDDCHMYDTSIGNWSKIGDLPGGGR